MSLLPQPQKEVCLLKKLQLSLCLLCFSYHSDCGVDCAGISVSVNMRMNLL